MAKEEEKKKSLEETLKELNKKYGDGAVIKGTEKQNFEEVISTGSLGLDLALGIGGLPKRSGKIIEVIGWESAGKSTLIQTIVGNYQKAGEKVLYIDGEHSLDKDYATALGINLKDLFVIQLDGEAGEGAYDKMEQMVDTGEIGLVVIDSYNALQPKKVVEGEMSDVNMGLHARMLGKAVMKANNLATKYGTDFIFIGQLRERIGIMFGDPATTQGGNALKFYSHIRLKVTRSTTNENSVMENGEKMGNKTSVNVFKNKLAPPFRSCSFDIIYGKGIDKIGEIMDLGHELGIAKIHGKSITYDGVKYEKATFKKMLEDNPELFIEMREKIIRVYNEPLKEVTNGTENTEK